MNIHYTDRHDRRCWPRPRPGRPTTSTNSLPIGATPSIEWQRAGASVWSPDRRRSRSPARSRTTRPSTTLATSATWSSRSAPDSRTVATMTPTSDPLVERRIARHQHGECQHPGRGRAGAQRLESVSGDVTTTAFDQQLTCAPSAATPRSVAAAARCASRRESTSGDVTVRNIAGELEGAESVKSDAEIEMGMASRVQVEKRRRVTSRGT